MKFSRDFASEGRMEAFDYAEENVIADKEESNNPNREWWDSVYATNELRKAEGKENT